MATEKAPWEQDYAEDDSSVPPWEQYGSVDASATIEEQHPDISFPERLALKGFANNGEAGQNSIDFLKKRHPGLLIEAQNGRLKVRRPNEPEWRVLDPSASKITDWPKDVVESLYDLVSGSASVSGGAIGATGGAALGAMTGPLAPALVPTLATLGAMAGSGTAAGLSDVLKQYIGKGLGVNSEFNPEETKWASGIGAAIPGAGALIKGPIKSAAYNKVADKIPGWVNRGPIRSAWLAMAGIPGEIYDDAVRMFPKLKALEQNGILDAVTEMQDKVVGGVTSAKQKIGEMLAGIMQSAGKDLPTQDMRIPLLNLIREREAEFARTGSNDALSELQALKAQYSSLFGRAAEAKDVTAQIVGMAPKEAEDMANRLGARAIQSESPLPLVPVATGDGGIMNAPVIHMVPQQGPGVPVTRYVADEIPNTMNAMDLWRLQREAQSRAKQYRIGNQRNMVSNRSDPSDKASPEMIRALDETANSAQSVFDSATDGLSSAAKSKYRDMASLSRDLNNLFNTPSATYRTLTTLGGKNKRVVSEILERADKELGMNVGEDARLLTAHNFLGSNRPGGLPLFPYSTQGVTSTSRTITADRMAEAVGDALQLGSSGVSLRSLGLISASPLMVRKQIGWQEAPAWLRMLLNTPGVAARGAAIGAAQNNKKELDQ